MSPNHSQSHPSKWQPTGLVTTLLSPGARQVIRCWLGPFGFLDEQQHPRMLHSIINEPGTFGDLVRTANSNLAPAVVLNELLRKGIVETLESGHVLLRRSAYAPATEALPLSAGGFEESIAAYPPRRRFNDI
ncbi:hypothetical protein [Marinobacter shengliensis]|uniref:hypothetical protein n=1 Tax=Marinobacter shengliensis TaxID=1389223 RepID=UPI001108B6AA|nr:hypothetical protein [Marinobacter shengliensis]